MKIGVGITVHNRFGITDKTVNMWKKVLPNDAVLVIVDDASSTPYKSSTYRFDHNVGIARAKNKCLELLEDAEVTDAFLADSDCFPKVRHWWKPYVESPEPHLSYQFEDLAGPVKLHDFGIVYKDSDHVAYTGQRGCLLYYHLPTVLPQVGGFDPIYGRALFEHTDLANRIHAAGLTTWRYADVVGSSRIWHSMDEHMETKRTLDKKEADKLLASSRKIHDPRKFSGYDGFVPYRDEDSGVWDVILTTLLTTSKDPQRGYKWQPDSRLISSWLESIERGGWDGIVIADEMKSLPKGYEQSKVVQVSSSTMNVYYQRWVHIYQFLRDNPGIRWIWCTDGSDVEILRDPFEGMVSGKLYTGHEKSVVGSQWMKKNHPSERLQKFIRENQSKVLLNAGVVGGDRKTVMELAHRIIRVWEDTCLDRSKTLPGRAIKEDIGDMAAYNLAAYELFENRMHYGPDVTTDFRANRDNGKARFRHK